MSTKDPTKGTPYSKTFGDALKTINGGRECVRLPQVHTLTEVTERFEQCKQNYDNCKEKFRLALVNGGYHQNTIRAILNPNAPRKLTEAERLDWKAYNAYRNYGRVAKDLKYSQTIRDLAQKCEEAAEALEDAQRTYIAFQKNKVPSITFVITR